MGPRIAGAATVALLLALIAGADEKKSTLDTIRPFRSHGHPYDGESIEAMRPRIMGRHGALATGHYLATLAGIEALRKGGNAFDAGVTAAMALKTTKMDYAGWTGVAPLILYSSRDGEVVTRVGAGTTPARATLAHFLERGKTDINTALVPADVDVWLAALDRYGTISFEEVAAPALQIAEGGYHLYKHQKGLLDENQERILRFPYNARFWFPNGAGNQKLGDLMVNRDLGRLIRSMMDAERKALTSGGSRSDGIRAARDAFYRGEPARAAAELYATFDDGLMTYEDLAGYESKWMAPLTTTFRGYDVHVCDGWSQGPRLVLFLNMLESFDLEALGYNTPEYVHVLSQVINLGMADTHKYVGDPDFGRPPPALYSKEYARKRAALVDPEKAFPDMPPWGDPERMEAVAKDSPRSFAAPTEEAALRGAPLEDTSSLSVVDGEGNVFSMTESDGQMVNPLVPGWGFGLGRRGEQLNLDPELANVMAPRKRPRNTNSPILVTKDGKPFLALSTPGGDEQLQAILQIFLSVVVWGLSPEQAVDQPRFGSYNFPGTGHEVNEHPAVLKLEGRFPEETSEALRKKGHAIEPWELWDWHTGAITLTYRDPDTGLLIAAGDVRRETSALGY
jgi:gamma-glutamyltranspeptidase/glutathione hydrolase